MMFSGEGGGVLQTMRGVDDTTALAPILDRTRGTSSGGIGSRQWKMAPDSMETDPWPSISNGGAGGAGRLARVLGQGGTDLSLNRFAFPGGGRTARPEGGAGSGGATTSWGTAVDIDDGLEGPERLQQEYEFAVDHAKANLELMEQTGNQEYIDQARDLYEKVQQDRSDYNAYHKGRRIAWLKMYDEYADKKRARNIHASWESKLKRERERQATLERLQEAAEARAARAAAIRNDRRSTRIRMGSRTEAGHRARVELDIAIRTARQSHRDAGTAVNQARGTLRNLEGQGPVSARDRERVKLVLMQLGEHLVREALGSVSALAAIHNRMFQILVDSVGTADFDAAWNLANDVNSALTAADARLKTAREQAARWAKGGWDTVVEDVKRSIERVNNARDDLKAARKAVEDADIPGSEADYERAMAALAAAEAALTQALLEMGVTMALLAALVHFLLTDEWDAPGDESGGGNWMPCEAFPKTLECGVAPCSTCEKADEECIPGSCTKIEMSVPLGDPGGGGGGTLPGGGTPPLEPADGTGLQRGKGAPPADDDTKRPADSVGDPEDTGLDAKSPVDSATSTSGGSTAGAEVNLFANRMRDVDAGRVTFIPTPDGGRIVFDHYSEGDVHPRTYYIPKALLDRMYDDSVRDFNMALFEKALKSWAMSQPLGASPENLGGPTGAEHWEARRDDEERRRAVIAEDLRSVLELDPNGPIVERLKKATKGAYRAAETEERLRVRAAEERGDTDAEFEISNVKLDEKHLKRINNQLLPEATNADGQSLSAIANDPRVADLVKHAVALNSTLHERLATIRHDLNVALAQYVLGIAGAGAALAPGLVALVAGSSYAAAGVLVAKQAALGYVTNLAASAAGDVVEDVFGEDVRNIGSNVLTVGSLILGGGRIMPNAPWSGLAKTSKRIRDSLISTFDVGRSLGAAARRYSVRGGFHILEGQKITGKSMARGREIRDVDRLVSDYPGSHSSGWRKMKAETTIVRDSDGSPVRAEIHWYEHHGVGRVEFKPKRFL
jgi:hypothetical protein